LPISRIIGRVLLGVFGQFVYVRSLAIRRTQLATEEVMEASVILLLALAIDAVFGDPVQLYERIPHPAVLAGRAVEAFDKRLNSAALPDTAKRVRGVLTIGCLLLGASGLGWLIAEALALVPFGWIGEAAVASTFLAQRSLFEHVRSVAEGFEAGGLVGARDAVARIVGRDPDSLDEFGVRRAAIESLAENFSDAVLAPAFWYLLAGLPGLIAYKTLNTADSMIGHRTEKHRAFGWAAARLDDLANLVPARLAALAIAFGGFAVPGADPRAALLSAWRDGSHHRSINAGWPEAAMAGALGLRIAGPRYYDGAPVDDAWMGDGRAEIAADDLTRALRLFVAACWTVALAIGFAWTIGW